jgi:hypothetical protein
VNRGKTESDEILHSLCDGFRAYLLRLCFILDSGDDGMTIFYILIFLTGVCNAGLIDTGSTIHIYPQTHNCQKSDARMEVVDNLDEMVNFKNQSIGKTFYASRTEPDKIYRITVKDGKVERQEVSIVPITRLKKKMVEQFDTEIVGYEVK